MTKRNIIIGVSALALVIIIWIWLSNRNNANASGNKTAPIDTTKTNVISAMRYPTDSATVTTSSDAPISLDNVVSFDASDNVLTDTSITPTTTREIATVTSRTYPSGTTLNPIGMAFILGKDGLTHKYYQITDTDYVLADYVSKLGTGTMGH